jgi:four helix bundle protein
MRSEFRTLETAIEFARICQKLSVPRHLKDQLNRSSSSVALNLAEGSAKDSRADRYRSYRIALGSFREAETILRISRSNSGALQILTNKLAAQITNLCNSQH